MEFGFHHSIRKLRLQQSINGVVGVMIVQPFDAANDAVELEAEPFGNGAAPVIFHRTLNRDAVQLPSIETMNQQRVATRRHDALALMTFIEPITQGRPTVRPVHVEMINRAAKCSIEPDACVKAPVVRVLGLPHGDGALTIRLRIQQIHPPVPSPQIGPVGMEHAKKFFGMRVTNQTHLGAFVDGTTKHVSKNKTQSRRPRRGVGFGSSQATALTPLPLLVDDEAVVAADALADPESLWW